VAGVYQFIERSEAAKHQPAKHQPQGIIGQGIIIYQGGHWFFRSADAMRTADDLGRFRLQYGMGVPMFGMHGSFIVVRGIDDARLSFDVGPGNSIAEDAAWALRAWHKGFRFAWVDGFLYEQPPQNIRDFIKQRSRWLIGIRGVLRDQTIPLRYRLCLGIFTYSWHFSLFPTMVAMLALFTRTTAFFWVQVPANFVWAVFFLSYLQGIDMQVRRTARFCSRTKMASFWLRVLAYPFALGIFWYTLLESVSIFYSCICPNQGFFVIRKSRLHRKHA
jgi:egghead protein (zeste-white 4 protein)